MLAEWFHYLTTPAPLAHRRMGYVRETVSLMSRSRRCQAAWSGHLNSTRTVITEAFADLPRRRNAVILGSGLLDDIPLDALARAFDRVVLVDAVHPWPTRRSVRAHRNVDLRSAELSGSASSILGSPSSIPEGSQKLGDPLAAICQDASVDFVVSANLLSQLPIVPIDWFETRGRAVPADLGRRIVAAHLAALSRLPARICLVTDVEQVEEDRNGRVTDRLDLLHGVELGVPDLSWDWDLAPFGEAERHRRLIHRVLAYRDWHPADAAVARTTETKKPLR